MPTATRSHPQWSGTGPKGGHRSPRTKAATRLEALPATCQDALARTGDSVWASVSWVGVVEEQLVLRAQRGDAAAFDSLVDLVGGQLFGLAYHIMSDPHAAEDAAQQALIEIWRQLPRLRDPTRFRAWSCRIVVRTAQAESARQGRWTMRLAGAVRPAESQADHATAVAERDELERGFRRLSTDQRAVLALKFYADRSDDQIAVILAIPVGTVRSRLYHSMRRLRAELDADARPGGEYRPR